METSQTMEELLHQFADKNGQTPNEEFIFKDTRDKERILQYERSSTLSDLGFRDVVRYIIQVPEHPTE